MDLQASSSTSRNSAPAEAPHDVAQAPAAPTDTGKLVSARGAAEILGVTDGAVRKMIARGTFPDPDVLLDTRRLWCRTTIETYSTTGRRRPGRPRKDSDPHTS